MPRNIEIKARARDFTRQLALAREISDRPLELLRHEDTFFAVPEGRLKLRDFGSGVGELIYYHRADEAVARASNYEIVPTAEPVRLRNVLAAALPVRGVVRKTRHLLMQGPVRIHFDEVEGLGEFIELEYVLQPDEAEGPAQNVVEELMRRLGISESDVMASAYIDLQNQP